MFDLGIWEMAVIGVVALVVLGPERLPKVARTAGQWIGKMQRYVAQVKSDINREVELSELRKVKEEFEGAAQGIKSSIESEAKKAEDDLKAVEADIQRELHPGATPGSTDATGSLAHTPVVEPPLYDDVTGSPYVPPPLLSERSQER
jgi:sec-independent protein translocase protein TatB